MSPYCIGCGSLQERKVVSFCALLVKLQHKHALLWAMMAKQQNRNEMNGKEYSQLPMIKSPRT